jgi:hypothetical protein
VLSVNFFARNLGLEGFVALSFRLLPPGKACSMRAPPLEFYLSRRASGLPYTRLEVRHSLVIDEYPVLIPERANVLKDIFQKARTG